MPTREEIKKLVSMSFGQEAADDDDIVSFYEEVNKTAMSEYAKQRTEGFTNWAHEMGWIYRKGKWRNYASLKEISFSELHDLFTEDNPE